MDFQLTEAQRLVRETARGFVDREIVPHARESERNGQVPSGVYRTIAELGFLVAPVPVEYGGAGMDYVSFALLMEEISRGSSSVRTTVSVQTSLSESTLMLFGSEEQKRAWLVPLAKGERFGAWALPEPEGGRGAADPPTHPQPPRRGGGRRARPAGALAFEDWRVPRDHLGGTRGKGWEQAMKTLNGGRLGIAAGAVGVARAALEAAPKYAKDRRAFGRPIASF